MPYDTLSGFQQGQSAVGPGAFSTFISDLTNRASQIMGLRLGAQAQGLAETERLKALGRFYQSPEGQSYTQSLYGNFPTTPSGGTSTQASQDVPQGAQTPGGIGSSLNYTPEYQYLKDISIDPATGFPRTTFRQTETPQSQLRRGIAEDVGKKTAELKFATTLLQNQMGNLKSLLANIPPPLSSGTPGSAQAAFGVGFLRAKAGRLDPRFREVQTAIDTALVPFLRTVEGISAGRLNIVELRNLGNLLKDIPFLNESDRQRRFQIIDQLLIKGGVPLTFSGGEGNQQNQPSSPFQSIGNVSGLPPGFRKR